MDRGPPPLLANSMFGNAIGMMRDDSSLSSLKPDPSRSELK